MESVAAEDFSDVKDSELIFSTRAGMITVSRNYEGERGKSQLHKRGQKGNFEPLPFRGTWTLTFRETHGAMLN